MNGYREVFKPEPGEPRDPGRIFYTITADDIGKQIIPAETGAIILSGWFGIIRPGDVGKRLYRVPSDSGIEGQPVTWTWQAEDDSQRDARVARQGSRDAWATQGNAPEFRPGRGTGPS